MIIECTQLESGQRFTFPAESAYSGRVGYAEHVRHAQNFRHQPIITVTGYLDQPGRPEFVWFALPWWPVTI